MRGFLAVARREIIERRFVFAAAAIASLVPFAVPLVRGLHGSAAVEARGWAAAILGASLAVGLGAMLGVSVLAPHMSDRTIGFYFARPLSSLVIWAGKLAGAWAIVAVSTVLFLLPAGIAGGFHFFRTDASPAAGIVAVALLLVPLCHAAAVAVRSRSPLLILDVVPLLLSSLAVQAILFRLMLEFAMGAILRGAIAFLAVAAVAVLASGWAAVARGRTDIRAAHRALSMTLWSILGVGMIGLAGYSAWVLSATPRDFAEVWDATPAQRGSWVIVDGPARGGQPVFLLEAATGRFVRCGADWRRPVVSADGAHAAWFEPVGRPDPFDVITLALDDPRSRPVRTKLSLRGAASAMLSSDGARLAAFEGGVLSIYDLVSGATLGSARISEPRVFPRGFFVSADRFRVLQLTDAGPSPDSRRLEILEFDATSKRLVRTGAVDGLHPGVIVSASSSGDRLLVRETGATQITLRDGGRGDLLATLREGPSLESSSARFVADGRIVLGLSDHAHAEVRVFSPEGQLQRTLNLPESGRLVVGGEAAAGQLVVGAGGNAPERASRTIYLVDLNTGQIRRTADRLYPVVSFAAPVSSEPNFAPAPGSEATKLFYGPGRSLVHFDPLTGERRVLLGKK